MIKITGVHTIEASEPCYLAEVVFDQAIAAYEWGKVTQETPGQPKGNRQVPHDERAIDDGKKRWAFFFHYLDFNKPLVTPERSIPIPVQTELPPHLNESTYEEPY